MFSPAETQRRYMRRFMPSMTAYVVLLIGSNFVIDRFQPQGVALLALAALPALAIVAVIWAMAMWVVEQSDEFIRMRMVQAMLFATALLLAVMTVWAFVEDTGMVPVRPRHLAFPLWCVGLVIGQTVLWLRDRTGRPE
ncbi:MULTISPECIES: hypothetical protein [unclassified Sphingomonas]|jgi:ABC-type nickel/cobalt efflux system permease component RcnA|uniref:hypothetical protein n=1 Tax=unclassified Sphingomonas TaxID=196159 RepID=UPI00082A19D9|nr:MULTISPECIES: hypothetical protein [unclassified Sphingomonas]